MHSVFFGILVTIIGVKVRYVISKRVLDPRVRKEVSKLTTWGSGVLSGNLRKRNYSIEN